MLYYKFEPEGISTTEIKRVYRGLRRLNFGLVGGATSPPTGSRRRPLAGATVAARDRRRAWKVLHSINDCCFSLFSLVPVCSTAINVHGALNTHRASVDALTLQAGHFHTLISDGENVHRLLARWIQTLWALVYITPTSSCFLQPGICTNKQTEYFAWCLRLLEGGL